MKLYIALYRACAVRDTQICMPDQGVDTDCAWNDPNWQDVEGVEVFIGIFAADTEAEAIRLAADKEGCDGSVLRVIEADLPEPSKEPYTLDELKQLGGKPYFHVGLLEDSDPPHWTVLDPFYAKSLKYYGYGKAWLAYRCEV